MAPDEIFRQLSLRMANYLLFKFNLTPFASNLSYFYLCGSRSMFRIQIQIDKVVEYGSNLDLGPQKCCSLRGTSSVHKTDQIRKPGFHCCMLYSVYKYCRCLLFSFFGCLAGRYLQYRQGGGGRGL